jgi:hypothetical protein
LAKHDAAGNLQWFNQLDNVTRAEISAESGNVYLLGNDFPRSDAQYLFKYTPAGELVWTSQLLPYGVDGGSFADVAADELGNVYLSGHTLNDLGGPSLGNSDALLVKYREIPGDFNDDGMVDAADYTRWRDTLGSTTNLAADGSGNGVIDQADYDLWRMNFGATAVAGVHAVPEPASLLLMGPPLVLLARRHRRLGLSGAAKNAHDRRKRRLPETSISNSLIATAIGRWKCWLTHAGGLRRLKHRC